MDLYKASKCIHIQNRWPELLFYTGTNSSTSMDEEVSVQLCSTSSLWQLFPHQSSCRVVVATERTFAFAYRNSNVRLM